MPIAVIWLLAQLAGAVTLPSVDVPSLPLPDLPGIPWPDVDLPDVAVPGWVKAIAGAAKFVAPVLIGVALAVGEVRRRRRQDELKARLRERRGGDTASPTP